ncbi:MAG: hypothetical protein M1818_000500 [Claussenomyces sp. TS43310]|nr:MAG: hypothetical protein M1818_000500 [Claussenomyces sp. TS43310]
MLDNIPQECCDHKEILFPIRKTAKGQGTRVVFMTDATGSQSNSREHGSPMMSFCRHGPPYAAWAASRLPMRHLARTQRISLGTKVLSSGEAILQHLIPRSAAEGEVEPYTNLHDVPKAYLHDVLRQIRNEEGAYNKVTDLVRYLIKARGEKPTSLHYDALLRANSDAALGSATAVADLLQDMKDLGIAPDSGLYHSALQALAVHPDYLLRSAVLREMKDRWFTLTPDGWHNVVVGLLRDRQFEIALDKLEEMQAGGIRVQPWLYDIFIYILCEAQELAEALKILRSRVESGDTDISSNVWQYMLDACSNQFYYPGTLYIWRQRVSSSYLIPSDGTCTAVLNTAARACDSDLATDVVRILAQRTSKLEVHHYEALLAAYVGRGDLRTALRILCIMKKARLEPSEGATRPIFTYLMSSRDAKGEDQQTSEPPAPLRAWTILTELQEEGHPIPVAAANVVLSAASNTTSLSLESTIELYKQLHTICSDGPNTATFNALLQGCSREDKNGRTAKSDAMFLASEMVALGIPADELTYDRLVLICLGGEGNEADGTDGLEDALRYVDEMRGTLGRILPSPAAAAAAAAPTMRGDMGPHSGANKGAPLRMGTWNLLVKRCAELGDERVWALLDEMAQLRFGTQRLRAAVEERWRTRSREMERTQSVQGWRGGHEEGLEWMLPRDT